VSTALVGACASLLVGACGTSIVDSHTKDETASVRAWRTAGVTDPMIAQGMEDGRLVVTVVARTRLPLPDEANEEGFARRAAKIVWRTYVGRVDVLELSSGEGVADATLRTRTWQAAELEHGFGPRPAGLDAGGTPAPLAAGDGPYRSPESRGLTTRTAWCKPYSASRRTIICTFWYGRRWTAS
jgi:hypothetical protein